MKVSDWCEKWLDIYKRPFLSDNGLKSLQYSLNHILRKFADWDIEVIKGYHIQEFLNSLSYISNTQYKVKVYFNEMLEYAFRNDIIPKNPMLAIKFRIPKQVGRKALTVEEQEFFINSLAGKHYRLLYLIYLYTGARRNEILKGSMVVDFENKLVTLKGTKTKKSFRKIPLFEVLEEELLAVDYEKYLSRYKPDYVTRRMRKHCDKIDLNHICVSSLRKTFSTRCKEAGVDIKVIQLWLGHSKLETTADIYMDNDILAMPESRFVRAQVQKCNLHFWSG